MWSEFEAQIEENEKDRPTPLRRTLFEILRRSKLRPGKGVTKKMVSFEFDRNERLLWEIQGPARNFFLSERWQQRLEQAGFACELRPYQKGLKDGGRHSALSREWSFGDEDCVVIRVETKEEIGRLLEVLLQSDMKLILNSAAVARWITQLRHFFPAFDRFDTPDPDFDDRERSYKLAVAEELRVALGKSVSDQEVVDAIRAALAKSNLLPWRAYWPMSPKGDADKEKLWPALRVLANAAIGDPGGHAEALDAFCKIWGETAPQGTPDHARQIAEFLFLHLAPNDGIYIRHSVRQDFWLEAVGTRFPDHTSMAETYRDELRFMKAVQSAFEENGLAPRDMIDVQSALWVVHNYKDEEDTDTISPLLRRETIEAAMDAYDRFRQTGEHGEVFNSFGEPRDYWVRSTRERENQVYPTKPLIGFILNKTELNGGWGQKTDAAARLHNAGFIIVDQNDEPVERPERYEHLMEGADYTRLCALNYFIEPARERGAMEVSIQAGTLADAMGMKEALPETCQALGGRKFQKLARVSPPSITEPNPSSSTIFTYKLNFQPEADQVTDTSNVSAPSAVNLILYGPPGTGKTYQTAWEAVRLCLGEQVASGLKGSAQRVALMSTYRNLVSEGRIEFVTFHQSMSYEEFVEGLRPTTDTAEGGSTDSGFRLEPVAGIFRRISERAGSYIGSDEFLDEDRSDFIPAQDNGENVELRSDIPVVEIDGAEYDLTKLDLDQSAEGTLYRMGVLPPTIGSKENKRRLTQAVIRFLSDRFPDGFGLNQLTEALDKATLLTGVGPTGGWSTWPAWLKRAEQSWIIEVKQPSRLISEDHSDFTHAMHETPYVLIIDEINRANISKVFGELITLLEPDKRLGMDNEIRLTLPYSKKPFGVPRNLHIIGTMNTADRSIALLDTALRRRFEFRELMPNPSVLSNNVAGIDLQKLLAAINDRIEYLFDREHQIGHAYFTACQTQDDVDKAMRHKVIPLLAEYFYEDWSKVAAVLGDSGQGSSRFLDARRLNAPTGMAEDDFSGEKLRWTVKDKFDFSEFAS